MHNALTTLALLPNATTPSSHLRLLRLRLQLGQRRLVSRRRISSSLLCLLGQLGPVLPQLLCLALGSSLGRLQGRPGQSLAGEVSTGAHQHAGVWLSFVQLSLGSALSRH